MSHKLTIQFAGICTHFRFGTAAGVPHRVVLPDASRFETELVSVAESPDPHPVLYYLLPHFPQLEIVGAETQINVPPFEQSGEMAIKDGDILTGVRLQVINAIDREISYDCDTTPKITSFVHNYTFSTDVVLNGRAACYFDLYGGRVHSHTTTGGASQTCVEIETDGPPELLVTPLSPSAAPIAAAPTAAARVSLGDATKLMVKNLEAVDRERKLDHQGGAFDFLLHYLTASSGLPASIRSLTPGMGGRNLVSATKDDLANALKGLADILRQPSPRALTAPDEVTPSCSDSQYP